MELANDLGKTGRTDTGPEWVLDCSTLARYTAKSRYTPRLWLVAFTDLYLTLC